MKRIAVIILIVICLSPAFMSVGNSYGDQFSEVVLMDAFEKGRSLVIVNILSVQKKQEQHGTFYYYKANVVHPVILGDLLNEDIQEPVELFGGTSYGGALQNGATYALFIKKDTPFFFCWSHRNNVQRINLKNKQEVDTFVSKAKQVYAKTSIRKFRDTEVGDTPTLPNIPEELRKMCDAFKKEENNRAKLAKTIYQSELGSRPDESKSWSSVRIYLPPKIRISRIQVLHLLGEPTLKVGHTYHWFCGKDETSSLEDVGILTGTFDQDENLIRLIYNTDKMLKWKK